MMVVRLRHGMRVLHLMVLLLMTVEKGRHDVLEDGL